MESDRIGDGRELGGVKGRETICKSYFVIKESMFNKMEKEFVLFTVGVIFYGNI